MRPAAAAYRPTSDDHKARPRRGRSGEPALAHSASASRPSRAATKMGAGVPRSRRNPRGRLSVLAHLALRPSVQSPSFSTRASCRRSRRPRTAPRPAGQQPKQDRAPATADRDRLLESRRPPARRRRGEPLDRQRRASFRRGGGPRLAMAAEVGPDRRNESPAALPVENPKWPSAVEQQQRRPSPSSAKATRARPMR